MVKAQSNNDKLNHVSHGKNHEVKNYEITTIKGARTSTKKILVKWEGTDKQEKLN